MRNTDGEPGVDLQPVRERVAVHPPPGGDVFAVPEVLDQDLRRRVRPEIVLSERHHQGRQGVPVSSGDRHHLSDGSQSTGGGHGQTKTETETGE